MIVTILLLVLFGYLLYRLFKAYRLPNNNIICFTGTLGSGKTYLAVAQSLRAFKRQRLKHFFYRKLPFLHWLLCYCMPECKYPATMYSNIPIQLNLSKKHPKYAQPLTKNHLLMLDLLPERCTVVIDELGQICSQWEFDNPYVMQNTQTLVRFFRHFTNGKMFVTDQVSSNIVKPIRDRLGYVYQLDDFHRDLLLLPFYKVNCIPLQNLDDGNTNIEADLSDITSFYFYGFLPYKWMKLKHYESRCFKKLYTENAVRSIDAFGDDGLYTTYLIDMTVPDSIRKDYKKNIEQYRAYLYDRKNALSAVSSAHAEDTPPPSAPKVELDVKI